jgi:hypothetical protein
LCSFHNPFICNKLAFFSLREHVKNPVNFHLYRRKTWTISPVPARLPCPKHRTGQGAVALHEEPETPHTHLETAKVDTHKEELNSTILTVINISDTPPDQNQNLTH